MSKTIFLSPSEEARIVERIGALERASTGEVRVHLASKITRKGIMVDAAAALVGLGMTKTEAHNGVLLYIAVNHHQFAIIGDEGIHGKVGQEGWNHAARALEEHFRAGRFADGILAALDEVGAVLVREFPAVAGATNVDELSNDLSRG